MAKPQVYDPSVSRDRSLIVEERDLLEPDFDGQVYDDLDQDEFLGYPEEDLDEGDDIDEFLNETIPFL